ncbi:Fe-S cluster assembly sulfur transfer protein SufU [Helcococcus sueciensis]|uniref:Fe-S cluster assembly sulfur transfer protein SufU n=1 Tax=Helcococcus sueciensis TaxID=241555 RepID=UPI0004081A1E|nr:SUF system NifU family Fe-S cluster assembly protein [Helcococcus sueciensis]
MEINQIYTELIREHSMESENKKELKDRTDHHMGINPSCGDELEISIKLNGDIIEDASYTGMGCAISQASASMMIDVIKGKTVKEAKEAIEVFLKMIKSEIEDEDDLLILEDAAILESISKLPQRVKCAVLSWRTLEEILSNK